jgi:hypothetical protein
VAAAFRASTAWRPTASRARRRVQGATPPHPLARLRELDLTVLDG